MILVTPSSTIFKQSLLILIVLVAWCKIANSASIEELVTNPHPATLSTGIYFRPGITLDQRRIIVEDLAWLHARGRLSHSEKLAALMNIDSPLDGASIVAWILDRVHVIESLSECTALEQFVITNLRPNHGLLFFRDGERGSCLKHEEELAHVILNQTPSLNKTAELLGYIVDDNIITEKPRDVDQLRPQIVGLKLRFFELPRIVRLSIIVHEARHIEKYSPHHVECLPGDWASKTRTIGGITTFKKDAEQGCDNFFSGAYGFSNNFVRMMSFNCSCTAAERWQILRQSQFQVHNVYLKERYDFPAVSGLDSDESSAGIIGEKFYSFPDQQFFEQLLDSVDTDGDNSVTVARRNAVLALSSHIAELARSGFFKSSWTFKVDFNGGGLRRPLDIAGAAAWIAVEIRSGLLYNYNVPLKWVVPCSHFANGCSHQ